MKTQLLTKPSKEDLKTISSFIQHTKFPNFFHSTIHYLSAADNPSTKPEYLLLYNNKEEIDGLLLLVTHREKGFILQSFTRRAVVYGEPLSSNENSKMQLIDCLLRHVKDHHLFLQFRINSSSHSVLNSYNSVFSRQDYLNVFIYNNGPEAAWQSLSRSKRWQIRKNLQNGVRIDIARSDNDVEEWYRILKYLYNYEVKKPLPPLKFFKSLIANNNKVNYTILLVVKYQQKIIGGILLPVSGRRVVHEWYICGWDKQYKLMNIYPSVMATWAGIDYMVQNGFDYFDFMGAGRPDVPYGVRDFKKRFGGELVDVVRYTHFPPNIYAGLFRKLNWM